MTGPGWALLRSQPVQRFPTFAKLRAFQARVGGRVDDGWNFFDACRSAQCTIGLFSAHYQPPAADWPANYEVAGFTPWLGGERAALPAEVDAFLAAGEPPVLVTLGTNAASAHPELFVATASALGAAGARAVILTSTAAIADQLRDRLGPAHGVWPFLPLGLVLGRCRAVVHAGGHGTNAAVFAAGVPSAIIPAVTDQVWHARRIEELGIGVRVRRRQLGDAVARLVSDVELASRARQFAALLSVEDGPGQAADLIERTLAA